MLNTVKQCSRGKLLTTNEGEIPPTRLQFLHLENMQFTISVWTVFKGALLRSHLSISLSLYFFPPLLLPSPSYCSSKQTHETLESTLIIKVPIWSHKFMLSTFGEEKKNPERKQDHPCVFKPNATRSAFSLLTKWANSHKGGKKLQINGRLRVWW